MIGTLFLYDYDTAMKCKITDFIIIVKIHTHKYT